MELVFIVCAALGGVLFLARLVLLFIGGDHHGGDLGGMDVGHGGDVSDSDVSFSMLSLQSMSALFLMFGLIGLAVHRGDGAPYLSIPAGLAAGVAAVWIIGKILASLMQLQSSGTLDMQNALGQEGTVYLRIRAEGTGKVQVTVQNRFMVLDAMSEDKTELATGTPIKVVKVVAGNTLVVKKL